MDDLDRRIADELSRNGRITSSELAGRVGITKASAAGRVRRLIDTDAVRVTAVFDIDAAGYRWQINCFIKSTGDSVHQITAALSELPPTWMVSSALGRCDVVAAFMFAEQSEMSEFFSSELPRIVGIDRFECDVVVRPLWYERPATNVLVQSRTSDECSRIDRHIAFPGPIVDIDALDTAIIGRLRRDGRRSNRRIAEDLEVSEGTIRSRIKRLQDANLMRIIGWIHPDAPGGTGHVLYLRIVIDSASPHAVALALADIAQLSSATSVVGSSNISAMAVAADMTDTGDIVRAVRNTRGVADVEVHQVLQVHFYRDYFVRVQHVRRAPDPPMRSTSRLETQHYQP